MKNRHISGVLAALLVGALTTAGAVGADTTLQDTTATASMTLRLDLQQSYVITIPDSVDLNTLGDGTANEVYARIATSSLVLREGHHLTLTVKSSNNYQLIDTTKEGRLGETGDYTFPYKMELMAGASTVTTYSSGGADNDTPLLTVNSGDRETSRELRFSLEQIKHQTYPGNYTDTLEFTVTMTEDE